MKQLGIGDSIFLLWKNGSWKINLKSKQLAIDKHAVLFSEDEWLSSLYPNQIASFDDYLKFSAQTVGGKTYPKHIKCRTDVVMDFPGNTQKLRKWLMDIALEVNASHQLIFLNLNNEQCLCQIAKRRNE